MSNIHSPEYQTILKRLIKARCDSGKTQAEVSEILQKPQSFISKCESGERRIDVLELKQFADIYNKTLNHFID